MPSLINESESFYKPEDEQAINRSIADVLTTLYGGKAWFKGGSYAYLFDINNPGVIKASDGSVLPTKSWAEAIDQWADEYVARQVFDDWYDGFPMDEELFRPVKASPMMKDGGPKWGSEQERHELDNMGLGEMASAGATGAGGIATSPVKNEGFADTIKRGAKYVKRGFQGWGDGKYPDETRDYNRGLSDDALLRLYDTEKKTPHSPADVQQRAIRLELKRRGIEVPTSPVRYNPPRANNTVTSVGETKCNVTESDRESGWLADSVLHRIGMNRVELLKRYGVEHVIDVVNDIADQYESWYKEGGEIGSSDISALVKEVERTLSAGGVATESVKKAAPLVVEGRIAEPIKTPDWHIVEALLGADFEIVDVVSEAKGLIKVNESMVAAVKMDAKTDAGNEVKITVYRDAQNPNQLRATLDEDGPGAKWRRGYRASGHPAGYKHPDGKVGPVGGSFTDEFQYGIEKKVPVDRYRDYDDPLALRHKTKLSQKGEPLQKKNAERNLKYAITGSQGKHGPVGKLPEADEGIPADKENKFHEKLDDLVHDTFGHSKKEKKVTEGPAWTKPVRSYAKGGADDPAVKAAARSAQQSASRKAARDDALLDRLMEPLDQDAVFAAISNSDMVSGEPDHFTSFKPTVINRAGTKVAAVRASIMAGIDFERDMGLGPDEAGTAEEIFHYLVYRDPKQPGRLIVTYSMV